MEENVCAGCCKDLRKVKEIHAVEGMLYCSKKCAVNHQASIIIASAMDTAEEWYNNCAETITPRDIGLI